MLSYPAESFDYVGIIFNQFGAFEFFFCFWIVLSLSWDILGLTLGALTTQQPPWPYAGFRPPCCPATSCASSACMNKLGWISDMRYCGNTGSGSASMRHLGRERNIIRISLFVGSNSRQDHTVQLRRAQAVQIDPTLQHSDKQSGNTIIEYYEMQFYVIRGLCKHGIIWEGFRQSVSILFLH